MKISTPRSRARKRFGERVALRLIAVAHQHDAPRAALGKSAQRQLQAAFDVGGHAAIEIDALRNRHLVRLRGNRPLAGMLGKGDQAQFRARFFANQFAQNGLAALERFARHARRGVHHHRDGQPLHQQLGPRIGQRNHQRGKGQALQREAGTRGAPGSCAAAAKAAAAAGAAAEKWAGQTSFSRLGDEIRIKRVFFLCADSADSGPAQCGWRLQLRMLDQHRARWFTRWE